VTRRAERMENEIRVLVVEDEQIVGEAIRALLEEADGITVLDEATTAEAAIDKARTLRPDVILIDLQLPDQSGIYVIGRVLAEAPDARILVLTGLSDDQTVAAAFQAGALGYLLKTQATEELVHAIHIAHSGLSALHPSIATKLIRQLKRPAEPVVEEHLLSDPEERVLIGIARGLSNQEIAAELRISISTVRTHVSKILNKLHLENRTQAALYALRTGMVNLSQVQVNRLATAPSDEDDS
jgi:NarL family two-component system response regulator LiaR